MQRQGFDESLRLKKIPMFGIGCPTSKKMPEINLFNECCAKFKKNDHFLRFNAT
jgi:hypothetical protein